jgi:carbon storage regulator
MLVLSRKLGEKIFIGDNICITVVDIDRGKIRLGIEAPRTVPIYRQEPPPDGPAGTPGCRPTPLSSPLDSTPLMTRPHPLGRIGRVRLLFGRPAGRLLPSGRQGCPFISNSRSCSR